MSSCRMAMVPCNAPPFRGRDFSRNRSTVPPTDLTLAALRVLPNDSGLQVTSHVLKINSKIENRRLLLRTEPLRLPVGLHRCSQASPGSLRLPPQNASLTLNQRDRMSSM